MNLKMKETQQKEFILDSEAINIAYHEYEFETLKLDTIFSYLEYKIGVPS